MRRHDWVRGFQPESRRAGWLDRLRQDGRLLVALTIALALGALLSWGGVASAAQSGTCGTNGCIIDMAPPIYVMNNEWGNNGYGSGSITVSSPTAWSTSWDFAPSTDWNVISYPSAILGWQWGYRFSNTGFPVQLSSHTPVNTTVAFNYVPDSSCAPGGAGGGGTGTRVCRLDISYDLWLHTSSNAGTSNPAYEVMIWLAYSRELFSGTAAKAYATIGGHQWKVIQTQGGSSPVATFLLNEPADLTGATLNLTDFTDWLVANSWVPSTYWLDSVQFGTEIFKGKGTLNMTQYSASVGGAPASAGPAAINAGGGAVGSFVADTNFSGGATATNWTGAIDTSGVTNPAPAGVYQSERYGAMTYTIPGLTPGASYDVRLHFAENYFSSVGWRVFNVAINGSAVLSNFDILVATAGVPHKAYASTWTTQADGSGRIVIAFTNVTNNALVNGIEVVASGATPPPPPPPPPPTTLDFTVGATTVSPNPVGTGQRLTATTAVTATAAASGITVQFRLYNAAGAAVAEQNSTGQSFTAGQSRSYTWRWRVPRTLALGTYTLRVSVYDSTGATTYESVPAATVIVQ